MCSLVNATLPLDQGSNAVVDRILSVDVAAQVAPIVTEVEGSNQEQNDKDGCECNHFAVIENKRRKR